MSLIPPVQDPYPDRALHLATIRAEGDRLAAMPIEMLDAPVPSLTDWNVERVIRHVGRVHRWVTGLLGAPADADPDEVAAAAPSLPRGPDCLSAYRIALDEMLAVCEAIDPDRAVASFAGRTQAKFWLRRQAHELTVHRVDAADAVYAAGGPHPEPVDPIVAADGVAEWLEVFALTRHAAIAGAHEPELQGHSFGFVATEVDPSLINHWVLEYDDANSAGATGASGDPFTIPILRSAAGRPLRALTVEESLRDADVVLSAPAGTLLLTLWRRRPLDAVTVTGDHALAETLYDLMRF